MNCVEDFSKIISCSDRIRIAAAATTTGVGSLSERLFPNFFIL